MLAKNGGPGFFHTLSIVCLSEQEMDSGWAVGRGPWAVGESPFLRLEKVKIGFIFLLSPATGCPSGNGEPKQRLS